MLFDSMQASSIYNDWYCNNQKYWQANDPEVTDYCVYSGGYDGIHCNGAARAWCASIPASGPEYWVTVYFKSIFCLNHTSHAK